MPPLLKLEAKLAVTSPRSLHQAALVSSCHIEGVVATQDTVKAHLQCQRTARQQPCSCLQAVDLCL